MAAWLTLGLQPDKDCQAPRLKPLTQMQAPAPYHARRARPGAPRPGASVGARALAEMAKSSTAFDAPLYWCSREGRPARCPRDRNDHGLGRRERLAGRTFAEVRASRNTIETISLSRGNHFTPTGAHQFELAPSRQATNGQRRYSCRALRSRYTPEL